MVLGHTDRHTERHFLMLSRTLQSKERLKSKETPTDKQTNIFIINEQPLRTHH